MHELDSNQQIDKLLEMPSLQWQKPSDMLARMRQLCPTDKDKTALFCWMFLRLHGREEAVIATAAAQPSRGYGRGCFQRGSNRRGGFQYRKKKWSADRAGNQPRIASSNSV